MDPQSNPNTGRADPAATAGTSPDGGEEPGDREGPGERREDEEADDSEGGFWPWSGRRRIRRLRRELEDVRAERDELESDAERLRSRLVEMEAELEELRGTVETVERKTFPVSEFLRSVGDSARRADEGLAGSDFGVGDVEVTLRSRFAGADEGLSVQLPDPGEDVDPETLSTVTFRVGRGVTRRDRPDLLMSGAAMGPGEDGPDGYAEVPDVREQSLDGAREALDEAGFEVSVDYREGATPEGTVIEQDPDPFAFGPEGATVHVVVAGRDPEA